MTAPHIAGRADTLVIGLVALAHLLSHFYQVVLGPLFPLLKEEFGVSYTELGLTISVLYGVSGVCQAFVGILVDRYGGYRLMVFGVVTMSTAVLLMGFAPAYWVLLPLTALAALGNSVFHPADLSILSEKVHPSRLGRAFGIHGFGGTCGYFISPIIVYYGVTSVVGWRMGLIVAGLIGLSAALLIWRYRSVLAMPRRDPNFGEERGGKADIGFYRDLVTSAPLMSAFFYFVMVAAALAGMQGFTVTALVERFDTPLHLAAAGVTAYFFGGAVGLLLGGEIADRFRYPAFIASGGLAIAAVLMSTIGLFDMSITMIIGIMCGVGFWSGITQPSRDILVKGAAPERAS
ncbi:MAG: MFS transporter, partial [Pseudomonadota bacterium]|nr:MFS transporter [Pseudomonadota bacterium]